MRLAKRIIDSLNPLQTASLKDTKVVKEKVFNPKNSLGIKRKEMPQIEDNDQDHFLKWLSGQGVKWSKSQAAPGQIKPSQAEINVDAAQELADSNSSKLSKPVIISKDFYIIDGHHRWYAHELKKSKNVSIIKIDMDAKKLIKLMNGYDRVKNKSITNEKKSRARLVIEKVQALLEKLIVINKGAKSGQIVILAGGGGSGKGNAVTNLIDTNSYKRFDVDELKRLSIAVAKKNGDDEIANLDLRKPEDVFKLHQYVDKKGLETKIFDTMVASIKKSKELPNLLFDVTLKDTKKVSSRVETLVELGYKKENVHIIWVLAEYSVAIDNNKGRDRVVPEDILFQTHKGAAETMHSILSGNIPPNIDGEIYVIFSDRRLTVVDKSKVSKGSYIEDFLYSKVKDSGKSLKSETEIKKDVFSLAKTMVPSEVQHLF